MTGNSWARTHGNGLGSGTIQLCYLLLVQGAVILTPEFAIKSARSHCPSVATFAFGELAMHALFHLHTHRTEAGVGRLHPADSVRVDIQRDLAGREGQRRSVGLEASFVTRVLHDKHAVVPKGHRSALRSSGSLIVVVLSVLNLLLRSPSAQSETFAGYEAREAPTIAWGDHAQSVTSATRLIVLSPHVSGLESRSPIFQVGHFERLNHLSMTAAIPAASVTAGSTL